MLLQVWRGGCACLSLTTQPLPAARASTPPPVCPAPLRWPAKTCTSTTTLGSRSMCVHYFVTWGRQNTSSTSPSKWVKIECRISLWVSKQGFKCCWLLGFSAFECIWTQFASCIPKCIMYWFHLVTMYPITGLLLMMPSRLDTTTSRVYSYAE